MLENSFERLYHHLRVDYYRKLVAHTKRAENSLSISEAFCAEIIFLLKNPTIGEFAAFLGISQSNATYKIASLIEKGYIKKVLSNRDKREYHLQIGDKKLDYIGLENKEIAEKIALVENTFSYEELCLLKRLFDRLSGFSLLQLTGNP